MPLPKRPQLEIYDPRLGEEYPVETTEGVRLSLLEHNILVVSYYPGRIPGKVGTPPSLELDELNQLTKMSLLKTGEKGFFAISPLTDEVRKSSLLHIDRTDKLLDSIIGYFDLDIQALEIHFDQRTNLASYAEWIIGSCKDTFPQPVEPRWYQKVICWNIELLFTQVDNIGSISLFNGETGESVLFTRIYDGIDNLLEPLKELKKKL